MLDTGRTRLRIDAALTLPVQENVLRTTLQTWRIDTPESI
jgi:hypothetical protein